MILQIDIPDEVSKELKIFKIRNDFNTQEQAVIYILKNSLIEVEEQDA